VDIPFLLVRSTVGDTGTRPTGGVFWESPDITLVPGVAPRAAPPLPPDFDGTAQADADNTVYARIWNLGAVAARAVSVEFYWFDPTIGISQSAGHLIGATVVDVEAQSHTVARCPVAWRAQFLNGGHECLVVRVSQPPSDPLGQPPWDAAMNRHVAQRNIHVVRSPGIGETRIRIQVAMPRQTAARISVSSHETHLVRLGDNLPVEDIGSYPDNGAGDGFGLRQVRKTPQGECESVVFTTTAPMPRPGRSRIFRILGYDAGGLLGGYTVLMNG
jgi:hypothetical protein